MRRRIQCLIPLLAAAALVLGPALGAAAAGSIQMTVKAGFDGKVKPGAWVPLTVEIVNSGDEMTGELRVDHKPQGGPSPYQIRHSLPVSLPAGATKRFTLYAPVDPGSGARAVQLVSGEQLVAQQNVSLQFDGDLMVGLLGPRREDLAALAAVQFPDGRSTTLVQLTAADLPDRIQALRNLDALVLAGFSAAELTDAQRQAIQDWVYEGGQLILAGGPEAHRTLTPWLPWVTLELQGQTRAELHQLATLAGTPLAAVADVSRATLTNARTLAAAGDLPLVAVWPRGQGAVVYLAFDPTLEPVHGWSGSAALWARLLQSRNWTQPWQQRGEQEMFFWQSLARAAQHLPPGSMPQLGWVRTALLVYILLLGPVTFVLLRRLRRAEWAWITTPVLVLLFAGGTWAKTTLANPAQVMAQQVSMVELDAGGSARVSTLVGVFLPANHSVELAFARPVALEGVIPESYFHRGGSLPVGIEIGGGGTGPARFAPMGLWTMRSVAARTTAQVGRLETDLLFDGTTLGGTVRNGTSVHLRDVMVYLGGGSHMIGDLAPGETAQVTIMVNTNGNAKELGPDRFEMALRESLWSRPLNPSGAESDQRRERDRRMALINALSHRRPDLSRPVVVGWADWTPVGITVNGAPFAPFANAVFVQSADYRLTDGEVTLPFGLLTGTPVAWEGKDFGFGPHGWGIPQQGSVTVEFNLPLKPQQVTGLRLHVPIMDGRQPAGALVTEFWDWEAQRWVEWAYDGGQTSVPDPQRWVNAGGTVHVRVRQNAQQPFPTGIPSLSVTGKVS